MNSSISQAWWVKLMIFTRVGAFVKFTHLHKQINPSTTKTEQIHPHFCTNSPITYPDFTYSRGCLLWQKATRTHQQMHPHLQTLQCIVWNNLLMTRRYKHSITRSLDPEHVYVYMYVYLCVCAYLCVFVCVWYVHADYVNIYVHVHIVYVQRGFQLS